MANILSTEKRIQMVQCLVEGCSMRATARMCGVSFNTVLKFVPMIGKACSIYQDNAYRNLPCQRLQLDEIHSIIGCKNKTATDAHREKGWGGCYTWVAVDADSRAVVCWFVGDRSAGSAWHFLNDLKGRLANRVQISTDGHAAYVAPMESTFGTDLDYGQVQKIYGPSANGAEVRYSPAQCMGAKKAVITGSPEFSHISTSYVERVNLTMRMGMRRFTRLTNAHSKKLENHEHALALFYMHYNFARINQAHRVTPAMELGIATKVWSIADIVALLDVVSEAKAA